MHYIRPNAHSLSASNILHPVEIASASEIVELQNKLLVEQVAYLFQNSVFYREIFATAGVNSPDIRTVGDLARLPFTTKQDLRNSLQASPPLGYHVAASPKSVVQIQASSGTTGSPAYVGLTERDLLSWQEVTARGLFACGMRPGDRVLHGFSMSKGFVGGIPIFQGIQYLGAIDIPIGADGGADRLLVACRDLSPRCIVGTPNFLLYLASIAHDITGVSAPDMGVERLIVGGEPGGGIPAIREALEAAWGATCCELMGGTDLGCVYWAEDDSRFGMHMVGPDFILTELIDPDSGETVDWDEGARGELVYTSLQRQASPVLRFRSGDHVVVTATESPYGRPGPFVRCFGRTDDMLIVRGVNLFPSAVQDIVSGMRDETSGVMRVLAEFEGHTTQSNIKILVERARHREVGEDVEIADLLADRIRNTLSVKADVEMVPAGFFEKPGAQKVALTLRARPEDLTARGPEAAGDE